MPWWGVAILVLGSLELGFIFGHSVGKQDKYEESKDNENE